MTKQKRELSNAEEEHVDAMAMVNHLPLDTFIERFIMEGDTWKTWTHPTTNAKFEVSVENSTMLALHNDEFESCFKLVELTSSADYKKSKNGWKPRSKKKEMMLLDLKYLLVKDSQGEVHGFCSFMPTIEDGYAVLYCYEIHLNPSLQRTGLGKILMQHLEIIAAKIPEVKKVMLTVFLSNDKAASFYKKLGYSKDEFSPPPKILRNGAHVEVEYAILSKSIIRSSAKRRRRNSGRPEGQEGRII